MTRVRTAMAAAAAVGIVIALAAGSVAATKEADRTLGKLKTSIQLLNVDGRLPATANDVIKRQLTYHFDVTFGTVNGLLSEHLQYGDVAAVLAIASNMPGGTAGANTDKVVKLRKSGRTWDQIADALHVNLADVADSVSGLEEKTHSSIKQAMAGG